jgi:hypothetical protein
MRMPLFREFSDDEIEAIQNGRHHPKWIFFETPKWYVAFIWGIAFLPLFFILSSDLWFTVRIFVAGFGLQLYHSLYYHKSLEKNIITTGFYMKRIPEKWAYVKPFYARDMLKWIYSMYGEGFHKLMRFAFILSGILSGIGLVIAVCILVFPEKEITFPLFDFLLIIPPRWSYIFNAFNVFSVDGADLATVLSRGSIIYNFKGALLSDWRAWYILLMFLPILIFYLIQMLFLGIRIYMLGSFLHHFGYWHHERKSTDTKHPISNLMALLILSMFLFTSVFMRLWAPVGSMIVFMTISPQSPRYNYFKQMSKTGRFFSGLGFIILAASMLWAFLPVPMPDPDRLIELVLNAVLIPMIIFYLVKFMQGTPKNPAIEFEGVHKVEQLNAKLPQINKIILGICIGLGLLGIGNTLLNLSWEVVFYLGSIGICIFILYHGWIRWSELQSRSIPLVKAILPYLDDDKAHESDNHFWEGFASGFLFINMLIMASLVFRRFSVYVAGFDFLSIPTGSFQAFLFDLSIAGSLFFAYCVVWIYFWTGTKGIHSVWHGLTVLVQKLEISGPISGLTLPPMEEFIIIGKIYSRTIKLITVLFGIYYIFAGLYLRSLLVIVLFGIVGTLFAKMYFNDIHEDYPLIFKLNQKNAEKKKEFQ